MQTDERLSPSRTLKAVIHTKPNRVRAIVIYRRNDGYVPAYGQVHQPVWEPVAGPIYCDASTPVESLIDAEFRRLST